MASGKEYPESWIANTMSVHHSLSVADKGRSTTARTSRTHRSEPLTLLALPIDIIQAILREITHTNDLTSLALTHSALHELVIPHIYSRFDIVWPEMNSPSESRVGVDALTYGLATLVMAPDVFGEPSYQQGNNSCSLCQNCGQRSLSTLSSRRPLQVRRGNHFARHTKKFSLGNGPAEWVHEYLITKEGGKMLGTLVALTIGRMRNLETFTWDMPTGVLRDVWLALASLNNRDDGQECKLDRVWVRWHDNQDRRHLTSNTGHQMPADLVPTIPSIVPGPGSPLFQIPAYPRVEFPTFSVLSPLKSLSVLDIDELSYVEEMSVLIERSLAKLSELRIGVAEHAQFDAWARPIEDRSLTVPQLFPSHEGSSKPGGLLGILFRRFSNTFPTCSISILSPTLAPQPSIAAIEQLTALPRLSKSGQGNLGDATDLPVASTDINQLGVLLSAHSIQDDLENDQPPSPTITRVLPPLHRTKVSLENSSLLSQEGRPDQQSSTQLKLTILEMERVHISVPTLFRAVDWTKLTSITLLGCKNHEQLWKGLRRKYTPASRSRTPSSTTKTHSAFAGLMPKAFNTTPRTPTTSLGDYVLSLRRIHTDTVSNALLAFIKDTLAPDSLEWLFLQDSKSYRSMVTVETIYRSAVRRHRGSLRKLLIDSSLRLDTDNNQNENNNNNAAQDQNWRRWICSRELLTCITSGRMQLRELSLSIDYKDWHFFVQRLPNARTLRSLHIAHIAEHAHGRLDAREAAMQILDIVALRPELELCYLGIEKKCWEVLEYEAKSMGKDGNNFVPANFMDEMVDGSSAHPHHVGGGVDHDDEDDDDEDEDSDLEIEERSDENDTDDEDAIDAVDASGAGRNGKRKMTFRLREILFYDDKVSIFKARHGKL